MRPCDEYAALLDGYVDGELSPEEMIRVQTHLETCPGCQAYVDDALAILMYTPKSAAPVVEKLLNSAIANAENNLEMSRENLYVAEVYANQGPTLKRYWARSHGRADLIKKHTSHITIVLDQKN